MSGTLQGAGGIGGLLARTVNPSTFNPQLSTSASALYHSDGNGNVTCLIYANQVIAAKYLYDPFGNTLAEYGSLAGVNLYRFSSKEWNAASCLYYYLYRFYNPNLQRWQNRDPLEGSSLRQNYYALNTRSGKDTWLQHSPSANAFLFVNDAPPNLVDSYGLTTWKGKCYMYGVSATLGIMFVQCYLDSNCEIGSDKHSEWVSVKGVLFQASIGVPVSYTVSDNTFVSPPGTDHTTFKGQASAYGFSRSIGSGSYLASLTLGGAVMQGLVGQETGVDYAGYLASGRSWVRYWGKN